MSFWAQIEEFDVHHFKTLKEIYPNGTGQSAILYLESLGLANTKVSDLEDKMESKRADFLESNKMISADTSADSLPKS